MNAIEILIWVTCLSCLMMAGLWGIQRRTNDAGIVDVGWAAGMVLAAGMILLYGQGDPLRRWMIGLMAGLWALRLGSYLLFNRVLKPGGKDGGKEDGRYAHMRERLGNKAQAVFFLFFQVQALFVLMFTIPLLVPLGNPHPAPTFWDALAVLVWLVAVGGEALADKQLARFRDNPAHRGKTCQVGLWRYSRHPNYFFEWLHWFAYLLLGIGSDWWWLAALGPVVMIVFLYKITGIPHTERQAQSHRQDYAEYQRNTSAFFPWFPKS